MLQVLVSHLGWSNKGGLMRVRELIEELQKHDDDTIVCLEDWSECYEKDTELTEVVLERNREHSIKNTKGWKDVSGDYIRLGIKED